MRLRSIFGAFVALLASTLDSSQSNHFAYAQDPERAAVEQTQAQPPPAPPPAASDGHAPAGSAYDSHACNYKGPKWFAGFYCFFAAHEKFWLSFGTLILAAATGTLGAATGFLWHATKKLVHGADIAAERQLRAWVFGMLRDVYSTEDSIRFVPAALNYGTTPAIVRSFSFKFASAAPDGPVRDETNMFTIEANYHLGPGRDWFPSEHELEVGFQTPFVLGCVRYDDIFKQARTTWFAFLLENGNEARVVPGAAWNAFD